MRATAQQLPRCPDVPWPLQSHGNSLSQFIFVKTVCNRIYRFTNVVNSRFYIFTTVDTYLQLQLIYYNRSYIFTIVVVELNLW
jgi:hypothetical protein